jgi:ligand-binding sensor domain-containing protein
MPRSVRRPGGRVWLGFENGEVAVHENDEFKVYSSQDGLPGGRVFAITGDRAGNVWIGGESGLSRIDRRRFVTITRKNGLPGNSVGWDRRR